MPSASGITFEGGGDGRGADWLGEKTQPEGTARGFPLPVALDTLPRLSPFPPGVGQQADHARAQQQQR